MKTQERITNENVRITENNVQHIGECIALSAIKKMMRFAHHPRSLDKLYDTGDCPLCRVRRA